MSVFGWRKRQIADKVEKDNMLNFPESTEYAQLQFTSPDDNNAAHYTVGVNNEGKTQLCIQLENGNATLTMDIRAVHQMIRLLNATLPEDDTL